ncbi:MAG: hypothetical protein L0G99_15800, partial [Propionibacteriales bacterium]|nr:hypothetical protein [Propionibacteriales bacterium]
QLAKCIATKSVQPRNCRFAYEPPAGVRVDTETIRWRLLDDPVPSWQPPGMYNTAKVSGVMPYQTEFSATVTFKGVRQQVRETVLVIMYPTFDLTGGKAVLTQW